MFDYKKLGLRAGLEIHQQLNSGHKLFCSCPITKSNEFPVEIKRKLRVVPSELGEYDVAAEYEYLRDRSFLYLSNPESSCLVELDEQPPKPMNENALKTVVQLAKLLHSDVAGEIHVMRKTVIDGSAVTGFQRTALIATGGYLELSGQQLAIQTINLEEDSAPAVSRGDTVEYCTEPNVRANCADAKHSAQYRLDRLGTPLVEIATDSTLGTPQEVKEAAEKIGTLLRSLDVVRGLGSIRQDVNVSIAEGCRVEIKGFQALADIEKLVDNEIARQLSLLEIRDGLRNRNFKKAEVCEDVTEIFANSEANLVKKVLAEGGRIAAGKLPEFAGLMKRECGDRTFGKELSGYAAAFGLGIIHSDELEKFPFLKKDFDSLRERLHASGEDIVFIVAGHGAEKAANAVIERANQCVVGVPKETRVADGTGSRYARPLPGSGRLYPESDVPSISMERFMDVEVPKTLDERREELDIPEQLAEQIVRSKYYEWFTKLKGYDAVLAATIFLSTYKDLGRRGYDVSKISFEDLEGIMKAVFESGLPKSSVTLVLEEVSQGASLQVALSKYKPDFDVESLVRAVVADNPGKTESALIGIVMARAKGRADGKKVSELVRKFSK
ncbi:MAG: glutamyl-tRNA(Gln) amidotransferase subunit E [archaeon GW2011_AR5]|nr:MAG: glutamyl-tRNA(Gln) amidotransferase subunit E [archaeon GW2011_AR5]